LFAGNINAKRLQVISSKPIDSGWQHIEIMTIAHRVDSEDIATAPSTSELDYSL